MKSLMCAIALCLVVARRRIGAGHAAATKLVRSRADNYDELLQQYLQDRTRAPGDDRAGAGRERGWPSLASDLRARRVNDLVTVRVVESVSGAGSADSNLDKNSSGAASRDRVLRPRIAVPGLARSRHPRRDRREHELQGGGSTTRPAQLTAVLTARVVEVLPNGDLALEGVREIDINGDRQILVLTGVVRTADIGPGNVVPSTAIGQMRIRYFGRGLIKDNLKPGWLVRVLNKIF